MVGCYLSKVNSGLIVRSGSNSTTYKKIILYLLSHHSPLSKDSLLHDIKSLILYCIFNK